MCMHYEHPIVPELCYFLNQPWLERENIAPWPLLCKVKSEGWPKHQGLALQCARDPEPTQSAKTNNQNLPVPLPPKSAE